MNDSRVILACYILFALLAIAISPVLHANSYTPRHLVVLVHGIGAGKSTFGQMEEALPNSMQAIGNKSDFQVISFEYDTGNDQKTTTNFAEHLEIFIDQYITNQWIELRPSDRISLIAHSQGGLITSIYLFQAFSNPHALGAKLINHFDSAISLGTPFLGAKTARLGRKTKSILSTLHLDRPIPFGAIELKEMSFGSKTITKFRQMMATVEGQSIIKRIGQKVRILNVVAFGSALNFLNNFVTGRNEYEDDLAVPLPSATLNSLYGSASLSNNQDDNKVYAPTFIENNVAEYRVVEALHVSLAPDSKHAPSKMMGVAKIPTHCIDDLECSHPSYKMIVQHLGQQPVKQNIDVKKRITSFMLDLRVKLADGTQIDPDEIEVKFNHRQLHWWWQNPKVIINDAFELFADGATVNEDDSSSVRLYFTGSIIDSYQPANDDYRKEVVTMTISVPGLITRSVDIEVKAGHSTYLELNLL
ncbi:MAG: hypothetical protein HN353_11130 [Bdellovibrionales bacterium]|nr:hypothetical protein [Bdellovibrionales bacterium]MBT3525178.1 hypothetical protein [Bdellovibrionales bacterium]MBT7767872.1 hypothetical protein [Bdellovibrionales bacterium]